MSAHLTRPHPFGPYGAGGQVPPEDLRPEPLELDLPAGRSSVLAVSPWQRAVDREPVRLWLWPPLLVVLALLVVVGLVVDVAPAPLAAAEALTAVGGWQLIERLRASVFSPRAHKQAAADVVRAALR